MIGLIDIGGGLRGIYTSGIYDYLLDNGIDIEYCFGVSSGSGNLINYVSGQRGRSKKFYDEYAFEKEYMSVGGYLKTGMLLNLDYIYSGISNSNGKDPLDYEAIKNSTKIFRTVATRVDTAMPVYFTKDDLVQDDYTLLKACCAIPVACRKPIKFKGLKFFDGGLSDPIPCEKAFEEGCDKLIIIITQPKEYRKEKLNRPLVHITSSRYPKIKKRIMESHDYYNKGIEKILELERQGKALVVYPRECFGINTISKNKEGMQKLYELGYEDGKKIEDFIKNNSSASAQEK